MSWRDLVTPSGGLEVAAPWTGRRQVVVGDRVLRIEGVLPDEVGWHRFLVPAGRTARWAGVADGPPDGLDRAHPGEIGYVVGERMIPDGVGLVLDPERLVDQTVPVSLVEAGLERIVRASVIVLATGEMVWLRQEMPDGPETEVLAAYEDRTPNVDHIKGVTPALDLAFRFISHQRYLSEERAREREARRIADEKRRAEEERLATFRRSVGSGAGRRAVAATDFEGAARAALAVSGAVLLDVRPSTARGQMVVMYRWRHRRLGCVVDRETLGILDSGICLTDHYTGEKGDTRFTLESLPGVVEEAMRLGKLVVYRGDTGHDARDDYDWEDD